MLSNYRTIVNREQIMNEAKKKLNWIKQAEEITGKSPSPLAKEAGLSSGTLTRFLKDPENAAPPRDSTLNTIARYWGLTEYSGPSIIGTEKKQPGFHDSAAELAPKHVGSEERFKQIQLFSKNTDNSKSWVMQGRGLENLGILEGDILIVDYDATPVAGDVLLLHLRDEENITAKTVFRQLMTLEPTAICVTSTNDNSIPLNEKMIFVDGISARIYGVVSTVLRNL